MALCFAQIASTAGAQTGGTEPQHITLGNTKAAVIQQLGWPTGTAMANNREVLTYPQGEVILLDGKVVQVRAATNAPAKPQLRARPIVLAQPPVLNPATTPPTQRPLPLITPAAQLRPQQQPTQAQRVPPQAPSLLSILKWPLILLALLAAVLSFLSAASRAAARQRRNLGHDLDRYALLPKKTTIRRPSPTSRTPPPLPLRSVEPPSLPTSPFTGPLTFELIDALEWRRFEELAATYFQQEGYRAEGTKFGGDGGIDIVLYRDPKPEPYAYVQCKAWADSVGVEPVRAHYGIMAAAKIERGYFVSSNGFTSAAVDFASRTSLTLITGRQLLDSLNYLPASTLAEIRRKTWREGYDIPTCASCGIKMLRRVGKIYWGCPQRSCTNKIYVRGAAR